MFLVLSWAAPYQAAAQENSLPAQSSEPILPDPVPNQGVDIPAGVATAVTAYGGPPKAIPQANCTPLNPCALASSDPRKSGPQISSDN